MPIQLPNLDNRRFDDLMEEALALIPTYEPEWTNHNPSDPGITLLELFAYLTEMLIYRLNRVTAENVHSFLKLLNGPEWESLYLNPEDPENSSHENLAEDVRRTVLALRKRERAVTCKDFIELALEVDERVARAHCLPRRSLVMDLEAERAGNVSLIVVPHTDYEHELEDILSTVDEALDSRRLLTTVLDVVGPLYLTVGVQTTIVLKSDEQLPDEVGAGIQERVVAAVRDFLRPLPEGGLGGGWPFGRNVFVSELYDLLDKLEGIDFVVSIDLSAADNERLIRNKAGELVGIDVKPYELVDLQMSASDVTVQTD